MSQVKFGVTFVVLTAYLFEVALSQGQPQVQPQVLLQGQPQGPLQGQPQIQIQGQPQGQPQGQLQGQPQGQLQGQFQEQRQGQPQAYPRATAPRQAPPRGGRTTKKYNNPFFNLKSENDIYYGPYMHGPIRKPPHGASLGSKSAPPRKNPFLNIKSFESKYSGVKGVGKRKYDESDYFTGPYQQARIRRLQPLPQNAQGTQNANGAQKTQDISPLRGLPNLFDQQNPQGAQKTQDNPPLRGLPSFFDQNNPQLGPGSQVAPGPPGSPNVLAPYLQGSPNLLAPYLQVDPVPKGSPKPGVKYFDLNELDASSILDSSVSDQTLSNEYYPLIAYEESISLEHFNPLPKTKLDHKPIAPAKVGHISPLQTAPPKLFNFEAPEDELPSLVSQLFSEYDVKLEKSGPAVPVTTAAPIKLGGLGQLGGLGHLGGFGQLDKNDKKHSGNNVFIQKIEIGPGNFGGDNFGRDFFSGASALRRFKPGPGGKALNVGSAESGKNFYFKGPSPYGKVVRGGTGIGDNDDDSLAGFGNAGIDSLFGFGNAGFGGAAKPEPEPEPVFNPLMSLF